MDNCSNGEKELKRSGIMRGKRDKKKHCILGYDTEYSFEVQVSIRRNILHQASGSSNLDNRAKAMKKRKQRIWVCARYLIDSGSFSPSSLTMKMGATYFSKRRYMA